MVYDIVGHRWTSPKVTRYNTGIVLHVYNACPLLRRRGQTPTPPYVDLIQNKEPQFELVCLCEALRNKCYRLSSNLNLLQHAPSVLQIGIGSRGKPTGFG